MPRKPRPPLPVEEQILIIKKALLNVQVQPPLKEDEHQDSIDDLGIRVKRILGLSDQTRKDPNSMLFFVMYDIESNKVRRLVSKYLERKGCSRIQRSIFLARTDTATFNTIKTDLEEVQSAYDNKDSIIVLPISTDYLNMMKIIGQKLSVDIITHSKNTLFF